ncbi:glycosyltransferase [Lusitaniella coriacea]|uniref:glycosyltransferase n=1 Tax=Lusitaniella coriacea TaxID=1983105 RepID=UPI003CEF78E3
MKTIQCVARYFPDRCGGIQTHLSELMPIMQDRGVESKVAASDDQAQEQTYDYAGVEVYRYPVYPRPKEEPTHGMFPHGGFEKFATWLRGQKADIYHQHQWTTKCGLPHLRLAKELGMTTLVSIRLPQPICQRRTLMLYGKEVCDGKIDIVRCSYCCDELTRKLPASVVRGLSQVPLSILQQIPMPESTYAPTAIPGTKGLLLRPLAVPAFVAARQDGLQAMAKYADCIFVMCEWLYEMLVLNGIPEEKLALCTHGIANVFKESAAQYQKATLKPEGIPLRVGFLGRWDRVKGVHVLIDAMKSLPTDVPIELIIHGVPQDESYRQRAIARIADDPRIKVKPRLTRDEVSGAIAGFDVLAIPSQWLETGPVVVLEAHALGVPVIGSDLGGIAEKVAHGVDGLLVPASDVSAWADTFARLATNVNLLNTLRQGIGSVRTISMEADDTIAIYQKVIERRDR